MKRIGGIIPSTFDIPVTATIFTSGPSFSS